MISKLLSRTFLKKFKNLFLRFLNAQNRNRTSDTRIFSPLLYQLSYLGKSMKDNNMKNKKKQEEN